MWPYVALISLSAFWIGLAILLTKWPRHNHRSISQHAAASKESFRFFTLIQSAVGLITYLFIILWFIPAFNLSFVFGLLYSIVAWLQIISAFIPDNVTGPKSVLHSKLAYSFAVGMIIISIILSTTSTISTFGRVLFALTSMYMFYAMLKYLRAKKRSEELHNYLILQVIFIVSFQVSILTSTFIA